MILSTVTKRARKVLVVIEVNTMADLAALKDSLRYGGSLPPDTAVMQVAATPLPKIPTAKSMSLRQRYEKHLAAKRKA